MIHAQRSGRDGASAGGEIFGFSFRFLRLGFGFGGGGGVVGESGGYVEGEDGVAAFGGAVLDDVFPRFLVVVFLLLLQGWRVAK